MGDVASEIKVGDTAPDDLVVIDEEHLCGHAETPPRLRWDLLQHGTDQRNGPVRVESPCASDCPLWTLLLACVGVTSCPAPGRGCCLA